MLADLKTLQDKLYQPEQLQIFLKNHSIHELIKTLNKATKKQTRERIRYCFSKIAQSPQNYKDFLLSCLSQQQDQKKQFAKYVASEHSVQFYFLLQSKPEEVLQIMRSNQEMVKVLIELVGYENGIKLVKMFKDLYKNHQEEQCLFGEEVKNGLAEGLGFGGEKSIEEIDTVAQMRYLEIVVEVAVLGGKCFEFVSGLLDKGLTLYKTEDILLKMAMVQIISSLGKGSQTSKLLKNHSIWKLVQKDASDSSQQLYVRKFLLLLLIDMSNNNNYQLPPKMIKQIHQFLLQGLQGKGQQLQSSIDVIGHLFRSVSGVKIVVQNMEILNAYIGLSRSTLDLVKKGYYDSLVELTGLGCGSGKQAKEHPKYKLVINILNCIGKPNMTAQLSHNIHSNNYMVYGLQSFASWFASLLQLPFEQTQLQLLQIFNNLLFYYQVIQTLLQEQETTKYLLRKRQATEGNKEVRKRKGEVVGRIVEMGKGEWKGLQLEEYSRNLEKLMQSSKEESMYALDVQ